MHGMWLNDDKICDIHSYFFWESKTETSDNVCFCDRAFVGSWSSSMDAELNSDFQPLRLLGVYPNKKRNCDLRKYISWIEIIVDPFDQEIYRIPLSDGRIKRAVSGIKALKLNEYKIGKDSVVLSIDILLDSGKYIHVRLNGKATFAGYIEDPSALFAVKDTKDGAEWTME